MGKAFNDREKAIINNKLKESAITLIQKYGMKNTTIDQLVDMANISKGSFYTFYPSKEVLFFNIIEDYHTTIHNNIKSSLDLEYFKNNRITKDYIIGLLVDTVKYVENSFFIMVLDIKEYSYLLRKLPEEVLINHIDNDMAMIYLLCRYVNLKEGVDPNLIASSLRAIFQMVLHKIEIGDDYENTIKLLLKGLIDTVMED